MFLVFVPAVVYAEKIVFNLKILISAYFHLNLLISLGNKYDLLTSVGPRLDNHLAWKYVHNSK